MKGHEAMILSRRRHSDARQKFLPAIFLSPIVVAKFIFFAPNLLFLRILRQWRSVARTLVEPVHGNVFRTRSHITRCSIERWYNVVLGFFSLKLTFFPGKDKQMAGEIVRQTPETVNSLKPKIAWPSLLLYRFDVLIIPDQFNC